jgi:hypothetical protein
MNALLTPLTNICQSWVSENIMYDDWQIQPGGTIAISPCMAQPIIDGLEEEGFTEGKDFEVLQ